MLPDDFIPDAVGVVHLVAPDGRWLCKIPADELPRAGFEGHVEAIGVEHGGQALRCSDCLAARLAQRGVS